MKGNPWQALLLALGLLTRLPVHRWLSPANGPITQGGSASCYPLVGALLGLLLWLSQSALAGASPLLGAFVLLGLWVAFTGALHLDGLADCVDGYFAGHKSADARERRERTLAVMREPACGAMAVVALIGLVLGKWVALTVLLQSGGLSLASWVLLLGLARGLLLPYMLSCDYARAQGMAATLKSHLPRQTLWGIVLASLLLAFALWPPGLALLVLVALSVLLVCWRALWIRCIGGFTGDCLGGLVELAELAILLVLAFTLWGQG